MLPDKLAGSTHVALMAGPRKGRLQSRGISRGSVPVELSKGGTLQTLLTMEGPRLPVKVPIELVLEVDGRGSAASLKGGADWGAGKNHRLRRPVAVGVGRRANTLAIYVSGAEVFITGLELRGLIDPRAVE